MLAADDLLSGDMLSGEEDEPGVGARSQELRDRGTGSHEISTDEEGHGLLAGSDAEKPAEQLAPSAHQRRQQRLQEKIRCCCWPSILPWQLPSSNAFWLGPLALPCRCRSLEEVALGTKDWFMRGEVDAGRRPKNSALEVDLDFETTVKPPPQVCEVASLKSAVRTCLAPWTHHEHCHVCSCYSPLRR